MEIRGGPPSRGRAGEGRALHLLGSSCLSGRLEKHCLFVVPAGNALRIGSTLEN